MVNLLFSILGLLIVLRVYVLLKTNKFSVDQNYWLLYRQKSIEQNNVPPVIDNYILELRQWYPPLFGYFISKIPKRIMLNPLTVIIALNLFRFCIVGLLFGFNINNITTEKILLCSLTFFSAPILTYYETQINSRIFGAIILDIIICLWLLYFQSYNNSYLIIISICSLPVLFSHKMTVQLYCSIILGLSLYNFSFYPIIIFFSTIIFSFVFLGYKKYAIAHIEIIKFWYRNKYKLGAHQFYESDIYGDKKYVYKNRVHGAGLKTIFKKIVLICGMFPFLIFWIFNFEWNSSSVVLISTLLMVILTMFVPFFYSIGYGLLYLYNFVNFLVFYIVLSQIDLSFNSLFVFFGGLLLSFVSIIVFYKRRSKNTTNKYLIETIDFLRGSKVDRLLIIPFQLPDEIAYKTGKKVFWGGHGLGFLWLENYFPVFKKPIELAILEWNLGGVVLDKQYWIEFLNQVDTSKLDKVYENTNYIVFEVKGWQDKKVVPAWAKSLYPNLSI